MSLQVWLPLTGSLINQGLADVTIANSGAAVNNNGKVGRCYSFDGSDDFISLDSATLRSIPKGSTYQMSFTMWVYHADSTRAILFGDWSLPNTIGFNIELGTDHRVRFYWNGSPDITFANSSVRESTWTHLAVTYSGTELKCYVNGVAVATHTVTLGSLTKTAGLFYLGRDNRTGTTALNGRLNDFRVYDHCLSTREVKEISKGLVAHFPLNQPERSANYFPSGATEYTGTYPSSSFSDFVSKSNIVTVNPNDVWCVSFDAKGSSDGLPLVTHLYNNTSGIVQVSSSINSVGYSSTGSDGYSLYSLTNEWKRYWVIYTFNGNTSASKHLLFRLNSTTNSGETVTIKNIKLEKNSVPTNFCPSQSETINWSDNIEYDCSGHGNNMTVQGNPTLAGDSPRYGNCISNLNDSNYIKTNTAHNIAAALNTEYFTISYWAKPSSLDTGWATPFSCGATNVANSFLLCHMRTTGIMTAFYSNDLTASATLSAGNWYHIVHVCNKGSRSVYLNGTLIGSGAYSTKLTVDTSASNVYAAIGRDPIRNSYVFNGSLSDFRMYATALSAADIKEMYNSPITVTGNGTIISQGEFIEE